MWERRAGSLGEVGFQKKSNVERRGFTERFLVENIENPMSRGGEGHQYLNVRGAEGYRGVIIKSSDS